MHKPMVQNNPHTTNSAVPRFVSVIIRTEEIILTIFLTSLILLACYQIGLRWFTSGGLFWIDPLLRYLVLWSGLLGAVLATAKNNHISLDAVSYLLPSRVKQWLRLLTLCFCVLVSIFLFRATLLFFKSEIEFGGRGLFGLSTWVWNLIFPIAFFLILFHFVIEVIGTMQNLISLTRPDKQ